MDVLITFFSLLKVNMSAEYFALSENFSSRGYLSTIRDYPIRLTPGLKRSPGEGDGNPVFLTRQSHGQRSLLGYSPWSRKSQT